MALLRSVTPVLHRLDHAVARLRPRRDVLVEMRTPVYHAVLGPIAAALADEPNVEVWYTSESPDRIAPLVRAGRFLSHAEVEWRRFDLYINGDPWAAARLRRCAHRVNFFHGVAGKYDLDSPAGLPMGFDSYTRVAFINRDRLRRYLAANVVTPEQAVLIGYPKLDRLASGRYDGAAVRSSIGLASSDAPTAIYAPTYSTASSLHLAGEAIVSALIAEGFNAIVKLHDRSLDADPRYHGGIDWRARFAALAGRHAGRVAFVETADSSPLLAAADVMVTDHSSVGFEYLVLDRPLVVFAAPELAQAARINVEKVAMLQSAATVVTNATDAARAARASMSHPGHLSGVRRRIAHDLFFDPGGATGRAVTLLRGLLAVRAATAHALQANQRGEPS